MTVDTAVAWPVPADATTTWSLSADREPTVSLACALLGAAALEHAMRSILRYVHPGDDPSQGAVAAAEVVKRASVAVDERFTEPSAAVRRAATAVAVQAASVGYLPTGGGWCDEGLALRYKRGPRRVTVECYEDSSVSLLLRNVELGTWETIDLEPSAGVAPIQPAVTRLAEYLQRSHTG